MQQKIEKTRPVVIAMNYPDYWYVIHPTALVLLSLLSYQMMNNGVHWASDYPFAIGMGYMIGKTAVERTRIVVEKNKQAKSALNKVSLVPFTTGNSWGLALRYDWN